MIKPYAFPILLAFVVIGYGCGTSATEKTISGKTAKDSVLAVNPTAPENPDELLNTGLRLYQERRYDKAKETLLGITNTRKLSKERMILLNKHVAFIFALEKNQKKATEYFLNAFQCDKNFLLEKAEIGNPYWMPAYEDAKKQFEQSQMNAEDLFALGKKAYTERNYDEALSLLESALRKTGLQKNKTVECHKLTAFIFAIQKKPDKAREAFQKAFAIDKNFELDKGEYGNPVWTPVYDEVKKAIKK